MYYLLVCNLLRFYLILVDNTIDFKLVCWPFLIHIFFFYFLYYFLFFYIRDETPFFSNKDISHNSFEVKLTKANIQSAVRLIHVYRCLFLMWMIQCILVEHLKTEELVMRWLLRTILWQVSPIQYLNQQARSGVYFCKQSCNIEVYKIQFFGTYLSSDQELSNIKFTYFSTRYMNRLSNPQHQHYSFSQIQVYIYNSNSMFKTPI